MNGVIVTHRARATVACAHRVGRALDQQLRDAVRNCLETGQVTRELGGQLTTSQVTDAILSQLA